MAGLDGWKGLTETAPFTLKLVAAIPEDDTITYGFMGICSAWKCRWGLDLKVTGESILIGWLREDYKN